MAEYKNVELMICVASRTLEDSATVVVGTGAPCAAAMLAQKTTAPNLVVIFEAGGIAPLLPTMPISVGDSRTFYRALRAGSMPEVMELCQRGMVDYAFLGGAQIDAHGNLNSTMIGTDYTHPKVRFPGSGGANDLGSFCWKTIIMMAQDKRRFVKKVDFVTTPGYLAGKGSREAVGLAPGTGPYKVITNLCVLGFDEESKQMRVESIHPGCTKQQIVENTGFDLVWPKRIADSEPPSEEELIILREQVDPYGYIIGR